MRSRFTYGPLSATEHDFGGALTMGRWQWPGHYLVWNARVPLSFDSPAKTLAAASLAAIGDNDYVLVYTIQESSERWIARFSLVPL
jgi:hypothetical protein